MVDPNQQDDFDKAHLELAHRPGVPKEGEVFIHYKGGLYTILAIGLDEDTWTPRVGYRSFITNYTNFRTLENWQEKVTYEGQEHTRFEKYDYSKHQGRVKQTR